MCLPIFAAAGAAAAGSAAAGTTVAAGAATAAAAGTATAAAASSISAMQIASLAMSAVSAGVGAYSSYQQSKTAEQTAKNNAKTAEYAAQDAQARGEQEAIDAQRKGAALKSTQRVNMAAKGLDLGYGTSADLQDQTDFFTQSDVATVRTNADKESWSRRAQSANYTAEADALHSARPMQAAGSLLSSASQVAGRWYDYRGK